MMDKNNGIPAPAGTAPNAAAQASQPQSPPQPEPVNPYSANPQQQYQQTYQQQYQQQQQYTAQSYVYPAAKPQKPRRQAQARDIVMAVVTGILCFTMVDCFVWPLRLGLGFALSSALLLVVELWYIAPALRHRGFYTFACAVLFIAGCASMVFSADRSMKTLTLFCLMILHSCLIMDGMSLREHAPGTFRSIADYFYTAFGASYGKIGYGLYGLFHPVKGEKSKRANGVGKALLGLVIALPLVLILVFLLTRADVAFKGMIDSIDLGDVPKKLGSLLMAVVPFLIIFCRAFSLSSIERERKEESDKGLDSTVVTFFLIGIGLVYAAYLFSQLAYFFSGFSGFLPEGFTYAEYARRGFFELTAVSFINIVIVILATAFSRKNAGKLPKGVALASMFLCLFSLILAATEIAKMKMYMDAFGLTRLRILTTVFMVFLAVVFIALIVHIFARRFPYFKVAVTAGAVLLIAVNFIGVDRAVAEYNVWAYRSGALDSVDVDTVKELGDAAVPSLLKLARDDDPEVAKEAQENLYTRWSGLHEITWQNGNSYRNSYSVGEVKDYDFRAFNTVSYEARELLLENEELFMDFDKK